MITLFSVHRETVCRSFSMRWHRNASAWLHVFRILQPSPLHQFILFHPWVKPSTRLLMTCTSPETQKNNSEVSRKSKTNEKWRRLQWRQTTRPHCTSAWSHWRRHRHVVDSSLTVGMLFLVSASWRFSTLFVNFPQNRIHVGPKRTVTKSIDTRCKWVSKIQHEKRYVTSWVVSFVFVSFQQNRFHVGPKRMVTKSIDTRRKWVSKIQHQECCIRSWVVSFVFVSFPQNRIHVGPE